MAARKKPSRGKGKNRPDVAREFVPFFIEMDPNLKAAIDALAEHEGRTIKAQAERLLREALTAKGFWPWPRPDAADPSTD